MKDIYAFNYLDRKPIANFDDKKLTDKISEIESIINENYLYDIDMAVVEEGIYIKDC